MSGAPTPLSETGAKLALAYFDHVERQVSLATTTSQLTVAAGALLINAYIAVFKDWAGSVNAPDWFNTFVVLGGLCLAFAFLLALWAAVPNLRLAWGKRGTVDSVFYFRTVAGKLNPEDYLSEFRQLDAVPGGFDSQLFRQIWGKCIWLNKIFSRLRWAITFMLLGTFLSVVPLLLTLWIRQVYPSLAKWWPAVAGALGLSSG